MKNPNQTFVNCPICNSKKLKKVLKKKWLLSCFTKCAKCKLIFQNPQENIKTTLKRYEYDYFQYELKNQENFFSLVKKTMEDYDILEKLPEKAKVLEIGCATGLFLKYMDSMGFESSGIEVCKQSAEYGIKNYGVNIINTTLEQANFPDETFDFIHFSHLIEHLNSPLIFLGEIYRILKKNGYIILTTPNASGLFAKIFNESWRCIVDDHLFLFNKNNLIKSLEKTNFMIQECLTWGSIPAGKTIKFIKKFFDWFVKLTGTGDVVSFLCIKK